MRASEFITESAPRTVYHGTLKSNLPDIMYQGLQPQVGALTRQFYGNDDEEDNYGLDDLVFGASKYDLQKALSSIIHSLRVKGIEPTAENIVRYGAVVVVKDTMGQFDRRPHDDDYGHGYYPHQVEPGDYYTDQNVDATYVLQNKKLKDLLRRQGFDKWMGTQHPRFNRKQTS